MMTLGPAAIVCAVADRIPAVITDVLVTFGRAPFAFYVAHLYLIHLLSVMLGLTQGFTPDQMMTIAALSRGLWRGTVSGVFLVWPLVVAALYPLCRWVVGLKARRSDWWLSYV